jgi:dipeptide/tripeptide permease
LVVVCRNLIGGFGPVAVAKLAEVVGLQHAMLLAPACYIGSGLIFLIAEREIEQQTKLQQQQQQQQQAALQQQ